ncbi:hypothetical protein [Legionella cardiaca]|uniref:Uncharacterized protein n=1 Tax=Legionella cardiaca TaxID=1071983 RepID=A0ABY8AS24_9GAMM|nr:hypothetical protein [Legionella cardiaca]WED41962.1 hypothetical protein PXX05_08435 [Legionella cardiaca]
MSQSKLANDIFFNQFTKHAKKLKQLDTSFKRVIQSGCVEGIPPGIFINEHHQHKFPKEFLIANFQYFKRIGIETLFFEFGNDDDQNIFDRALNNKGVVAINSGIINGCDDTKAVATTAIQAGIRVVLLDCLKAREGSPEYFRRPTQEDWDEYYKKRDLIFNENARRIFNKEHKSKPYLFYSGLAHGNNHHGFPSFFPGPKLTLLLSDDGFNFDVNGIKQHLYVDETIFSQDLGRDYSLINKSYDNQEIRCLKNAIDEGCLDEDKATVLIGYW